MEGEHLAEAAPTRVATTGARCGASAIEKTGTPGPKGPQGAERSDIEPIERKSGDGLLLNEGLVSCSHEVGKETWAEKKANRDVQGSEEAQRAKDKLLRKAEIAGVICKAKTPRKWSVAQRTEYALYERVQEEKETMLDFYGDVQKLLAIAFPGESSPEVDQIGLDIFLDGLTNIEFVDEAKKHRPKNCAKAYRWASAAEGNSILSGVRPAKDPAEEDRQRALKIFLKVDRRHLVSEGESDRTQRFADTQRASPSKGTELTDVTDIFQDSDEDKDWWETDVPEI